MKKYLQNDNGLTLVKILAAIVILAIVLVSFSSFFLQAAKHTKYNKEKLTAVQVAEEVIADVREGKYQDNDGYSKTIGDYKVDIAIGGGPGDLKLKKAVITVRTKSGEGIKKSPFITEMYFEATP